MLWRLGGKRSDFAKGPGTRFYFQHDARALRDGSGVSLFDHASQPSPEKVASGKVLRVDRRTAKVTLRHRDTVATMEKRSFETAITFTSAGARVFEVTALDRAGRVLARGAVTTSGG